MAELNYKIEASVSYNEHVHTRLTRAQAAAPCVKNDDSNDSGNPPGTSRPDPKKTKTYKKSKNLFNLNIDANYYATHK